MPATTTPPAADPTPSPATPNVVDKEIVAPKSPEANAILIALAELRTDLHLTREESRQRGEETAAGIERLNRKVDKLSLDDEALRLELRRLEQRQAGTDEDVRLLREELRKDREARSDEKTKMGESFDAMRRFVEESTKANAIAVETVTKANTEAVERFTTATAASEEGLKRLDAASAKFDSAASDIAEVKGQNSRQDERLERLEGGFAAMKGTQDRVAIELGLDEEPEPKPGEAIVPTKAGRLRALTRQQKIGAVLIIIMNLSAILAALLHK